MAKIPALYDTARPATFPIRSREINVSWSAKTRPDDKSNYLIRVARVDPMRGRTLGLVARVKAIQFAQQGRPGDLSTHTLQNGMNYRLDIALNARVNQIQ